MSQLTRRRVAPGLVLASVVLVLLILATFAIPVRVWRTGQLPAPRLSVVARGPDVEMTRRVWIDTDASCGYSRRTDPDDCFALLLLAKAAAIDAVGISTVFGNAPLEVADATTRDVVAALSAEGVRVPIVYRGSGTPAPETGLDAGTGACCAQACARGGPADRDRDWASHECRRGARRVTRPATAGSSVGGGDGSASGHLFHPAEGAGDGMLFGHGPVFRDFNFDRDRTAAASVLVMALPTTLIPCDVARNVTVRVEDLAMLEESGGTAAWLATRARPWLYYWVKQIGQPGFFPFDLLAGAYALDPRHFHCAPAQAWVSKDEQLNNIWSIDPMAMLVGLPKHVPTDAVAHAAVVYSTAIDPETHKRLMGSLAGTPIVER